jgi:hypothetical protein
MTPEQQAALDELAALGGDETPAESTAPVSPASVAPPGSDPEPETDAEASPLNELEMDEPIFVGGPTRAEVEAMKKAHPHSAIYCLLMSGNTGVLYRTITRGEWKKIQAEIADVADVNEREERLFAKISLYPVIASQADIDSLPAGAINSVMQEFYTYCSFTPVAASLRL